MTGDTERISAVVSEDSSCRWETESSRTFVTKTKAERNFDQLTVSLTPAADQTAAELIDCSV